MRLRKYIFIKQKKAYKFRLSLVGTEMYIKNSNPTVNLTAKG